MTVLWFILGLGAVALGAEALVRGASRSAAALGISPLVVGLTVVAYGTSTPELVVSIYASVQGNRSIAVANVVGSNIMNVLFILGTCAVIRPLIITQQLLLREVPLMIGVSLLVLLLALDGAISMPEALLLFAGMILYTVLALRLSRRESQEVKDEYAEAFAPMETRRWAANVASMLAGLGLLVLGARWLIGSAVAIAEGLGVSELVIGLTIVAAGTSLPEVATSVVATLRGERDIAVGNVIGSNLYNLLAVLGVAAMVAPGGLRVDAAVIGFDLPVMIAAAFACLPLFFTGRMLARWEGALFVAYYGAYVTYVVLAAQQHDALPLFGSIMLTFVLPLTAVTVAVAFWRGIRGR